ncbi:MAG: hypothetical protein K6C40_11580 [Thermoguttaceae bacterium]|nr:hypothetical protein [Thermoguttaceae bacterium]
MSNTQLPQNLNAVPPKDWEALARIGKSFRCLYLLGLFACIGVLLFFAAIFALDALKIDIDFDALAEKFPIISLTIGIGSFILIAFYVWFILRFWSTPVSIVPGGRIGRVCVVLSIVPILLGFGQALFEDIGLEFENARFLEYSKLMSLLEGILGIIDTLVLYVYLARCATAIGSKRVETCTNLYISGFGIAWALEKKIRAAATTPGIDQAAAGFFLPGFQMLALVIGYIAILFTFRFLSKDIPAFIEMNRQETPDAANLQEDQEPIQE